MADNLNPQDRSNDRLNFSLGYKFMCIILLFVIGAILFAWKPWTPIDAASRTISVTGAATVMAEPDQYTFNPSYEFVNTDKAAALKDLTKKSDEVVAKLKGLGVEDRNIKTNASNYDYQRYYSYEGSSKQSTYTLQITAISANRDKAQKIQDYLVTTNPTGSLTPNVSFSDAKRKVLENQARDEATKEARSKADQSAKNLGFHIGAVKSVQDGSGFGNVVPFNVSQGVADSATPTAKLSVQPGQNDLNYSVNVVYYVR